MTSYDDDLAQRIGVIVMQMSHTLLERLKDHQAARKVVRTRVDDLKVSRALTCLSWTRVAEASY